MQRTRTYWLWLAAFCAGLFTLLAALLAIAWASLDETQSEQLRALLAKAAPALVYGAGLAIFICAAALHWVFRRYPYAARQLAEQTRILLGANPAYRVKTEGGAEMRELSAAINLLAEAYRQLAHEMDTRSAEARARAEEERDRFAALMSELAEGVLVCNADGRILLYNERAAQLLGRADGQTARGSSIPLGLGRSVFSLLDRHQVAHALDKIHQQFDRGVERPRTRFVMSAGGAAANGGRRETQREIQGKEAQGKEAQGKDTPGALLRVQLAPFVAGGQANAQNRVLAGMVFTLDDVSGLVGREGQRLKLLQSIATGIRAPVANVRATAESLIEFPDMPPEQRAKFDHIVAAEARVLTDRLNAALREYADALKSSLTLEDMRIVDLLSVVQRRLADALGVTVRLSESDAELWARVDSYALVQAFVSLAARLRDGYAVRELRLDAAAVRGFAQIDLRWSGMPASAEALSEWESEPMRAGADETPLTLKDVLDRHGGELWSGSDRAEESAATPRAEAANAWLRFLLPLSEPVATVARRKPAVEGRPEYYDFDLFERIDTAGALAERRLSELSYTVFDTETTGLEPSAGDEIISIGAVRIVNGRLLKHEVFEQLVNPRRSITRESVRVHGIDAPALLAEPPIEHVLPGFHRFCEDTVLVAHNAAFDMRFLELKEAATGIRFTQPVLDTLLLSAVVHPSLEDHNLDTVAERLGVRVIGRHTALGDALVTGEVFLRLLPLLAQRGIVTLGQALEASRATYHARLQF
jgi:DNA polymerase-3 subunit epsilon